MPVSASTKVRAEAARAVARVLAGMNLDGALAKADTQGYSAQNLSLLKAMTYGVVREHRLLGELLSRLLQHPLQNEAELHALLLAGLFQLRSMRVAAHAAVSETVEAATLLGRPKMRGLVNAVLRRYQREREPLEASLPRELAILLSYPDWLAQRIHADWPDQGEQILTAGNEQGPLTLRVNRRMISREAYLLKLREADIAAKPVAAAADAVTLETALPVESIPGFADGLASVQDASAQLAADLIDVRPGMRVLDACAAPGGKTAHLLERCDALDLTAVDSDAQRLKRVEQTLARLHLQAGLLAADAADTQSWWDNKPFDRILLDAPCSGTGVIRRHPDIKWLRRESDIRKLAVQQRRLLDALWPLLAPGGVLLYAICSVLRLEGEELIKTFLVAHPEAKHSAIAAGWGEACGVGRRIAPGGAYDGFFYARLLKR